jgi:predicted secreted protein
VIPTSGRRFSDKITRKVDAMIAPATFVAIYAIVWWVCLFIVLPFGVRNQVDAGEVVRGTDPGAPVAPRWWQRVLYTTLLSIPMTGLLMWALSSPWLQEYWS